MMKKTVAAMMVLSLAAAAYAREGGGERPWWAQGERGRGREGRGGDRGRGNDRRGRRGTPPAAIEAGNGMVYAVVGGSLYAIDAGTMEKVSEISLMEVLKTEATEALRSDVRDRIFGRMDKDGDGQVSRDEFPNGEIFDRQDKNDDGVLTSDELGGGERMQRMRGAMGGGPVTLKVYEGYLYVLGHGVIAKLDGRTLELQGSASVGADKFADMIEERLDHMDERGRDGDRHERRGERERRGEHDFDGHRHGPDND